jgi:hypothetical protein
MRIIRTKYQTYELPDAAKGVPIEEYWPGVDLPAPIKGSGAKVYQTPDGPVIAMPARAKKPRAVKPKGVNFP